MRVYFLATVVLLSSLLVACGGSGSKNSTGSQQSSSIPSSTSNSVSSLSSSVTSISSSVSSISSSSISSQTTVAANQIVEQALGQDGGELTLATDEGAVFILQIPEGALTEPTPIRIETADASASQRFHLRFSPAMVFNNGKQVSLNISLPGTMALPNNFVLGYDGVPIPYTQRDGGSIDVKLSYFASNETSLVSKSAAQKTQITARNLGNNCVVPQLDLEAGGLTASDEEIADIGTYGQCMLGAVNALAASGEYEDAAKLASVAALFLQSVGLGDATVFINQASSAACNAYREVLDNAIRTPVDSMGTVNDLIRPVLFWEASVQQLGATCTNVGVTEYITVTQNKTDEAIQYYASRKSSITNVNDSNYTEAVEEARDNQTTVTQVKSLQPPTAVDNLLDSQITDTTQTALLDAILQAPWQHCRDTGNYDKLIELMMIMDSPESVKNAAQYCGTQLSGQSFDNTNTQIATLPTMGGVSPTNTVTTGSLRIHKDGSFTLHGPIRALQCPATINGSEELEIRLNGQLVQTLSGAPYLNANLQLNVAQMLSAAGLDATTFSTGTLSILRTGDACGGFWGNSPQPLLSINLSTGVCTPAQGEHFCVTPIEIDSAQIQWNIVAHNDAGVLIRYACASSVGGWCGAVWQNNAIKLLPDNLDPTGMADDGTVVGMVYNDFDPLMGFQRFHIVRLPNGANTVTHLASDPLYDAALKRRIQYSNPIISPTGRVTYSELDQASPPNTINLGFCQPSSGSTNFCSRRRWFSADNVGASPSVVHTEAIPNNPLNFAFSGDLAPVGRFGYEETGGAAIDFEVLNAGSNTRVWVVDETGNRILRSIIAGSLSYSLVPTNALLPDGWAPRALGRKGHLLLLSSDSTEVRLANLQTLTLGAPMPSQQSVTIPGGTLQFDFKFNLGTGWTQFDAKGRIAINADSVERPNIRAAILTPEGVELP